MVKALFNEFKEKMELKKFYIVTFRVEKHENSWRMNETKTGTRNWKTIDYVESVFAAIYFFRPIERKAEMDPGPFAWLQLFIQKYKNLFLEKGKIVYCLWLPS